MSKTTTTVKIATQAFRATIDGHTYDVGVGERVVADHVLTRRHPENFRVRQLDEELDIRSRRVSELREAGRPASREPVSRAGIAERRDDNFWRSVEQQLTRDERPAAERREQSVFDEGLAQIERLDAARLAEETDDFREMWAGRLPAERER